MTWVEESPSPTKNIRALGWRKRETASIVDLKTLIYTIWEASLGEGMEMSGCYLENIYLL